jgi:FtsP/CotA-like multicopper oxidase with cupredoxin domain
MKKKALIKERKNKGSGVNRRDALKTGLFAGAALVLTSRKSIAQTTSSTSTSSWSGGSGGSWSGSWGSGWGSYSDRDYRTDRGVISPATTPFVEALPIPAVLQPVTQLTPAAGEFQAAGEAYRPAHQRWSEFLPQKLYEIHTREAQWSFHPSLPTQAVWGYNGTSPGPTIIAKYGEPILVRNYNDLPANHTGYGIPSIITHLHNGHTASESDGFPADYYDTGFFKDHHYPNIYAGGDAREALGTLWYHDHRMDFTSPNVYKGLAGFFLLFDNVDSGNENDTNASALRLPSGTYDVPLIFTDKLFDSTGQLYFDQFNNDGFIGDKFLVNGKIQPTFKVARRKYRFRMLDGGPSRFYEFFLSNGQNFTQISNDGNLLPAPLTTKSVRLSVAERKDVIIDFSNVPIGTSIYLENRVEQRDGQGPESTLLTQADAIPVLRFDVDRDPPVPDASRVPATLRALPPATLSEVVTTRTWDFDQSNGQWVVNNRLFDYNRVDAQVRKGTAEKWIIRNGSRRWSHPIHIHFEEYQILTRNGVAPPAQERARKDVLELHPNETVEIFLRFRDFTGRYVMHCHNTIHEDHAMMVRFDIVP